MTRSRAICFALLLASIPAVGCGVDLASGPECSMSFSAAPSVPVRGERVVVTAYVTSDANGFHEYDWSLAFDGQPVAFDVTSAGGDVIEFTADRSGVYSIGLQGHVGELVCDGSAHPINAVEEGARSQRFVLRVVPAPGSPSAPPPQDKSIELFGGTAEYNLGPLTLNPGIEVSGAALDPDGQPITAYLRAWPSEAGQPEPGAAPLLSETFAGEGGLYHAHLLDVPHDLLLVPTAPDLPASYARGVRVDEIPGLTRIGAGNQVAVTVADGSGVPVAGARVTLVAGGVPSSVAETDGAGAATVRVNGDGALSLSVEPPETSGLPQLELAASDGAVLAAGGGAIAVRYAASPPARTVSPEVRLADGATAAPGSRVTWIAHPLAAAATVSIDGGDPHQATGLVRRAAEAGAGGAVPEMLLPAAAYDVVVEPPVDAAPDTEAVSVAAVDLAPGEPAPAVLGLAAPAVVRGQVKIPVGSDGAEFAALPGVLVQAAPRGLLVGATRAGASARTDADGRFALRLAGGGAYEIEVDGASRGQGRARWNAVAPAAGATADLDTTFLPRVLRATGLLVVEGGLGPAGGAHLQLFCTGCGPDGRSVPVTETVTDATGGFELVAPDPGVAAE